MLGHCTMEYSKDTPENSNTDSRTYESDLWNTSVVREDINPTEETLITVDDLVQADSDRLESVWDNLADILADFSDTDPRDKLDNADREADKDGEVPQDIGAYFGHPLNANDTHSSAYALLHEYNNLSPIDKHDIKLSDKYGHRMDLLKSETSRLDSTAQSPHSTRVHPGDDDVTPSPMSSVSSLVDGDTSQRSCYEGMMLRSPGVPPYLPAPPPPRHLLDDPEDLSTRSLNTSTSDAMLPQSPGYVTKQPDLLQQAMQCEGLEPDKSDSLDPQDGEPLSLSSTIKDNTLDHETDELVPPLSVGESSLLTESQTPESGNFSMSPLRSTRMLPDSPSKLSTHSNSVSDVATVFLPKKSRRSKKGRFHSPAVQESIDTSDHSQHSLASDVPSANSPYTMPESPNKSSLLLRTLSRDSPLPYSRKRSREVITKESPLGGTRAQGQDVGTLPPDTGANMKNEHTHNAYPNIAQNARVNPEHSLPEDRQRPVTSRVQRPSDLPLNLSHDRNITLAVPITSPIMHLRSSESNLTPEQYDSSPQFQPVSNHSNTYPPSHAHQPDSGMDMFEALAEQTVSNQPRKTDPKHSDVRWRHPESHPNQHFLPQVPPPSTMQMRVPPSAQTHQGLHVQSMHPTTPISSSANAPRLPTSVQAQSHAFATEPQPMTVPQRFDKASMGYPGSVLSLTSMHTQGGPLYQHIRHPLPGPRSPHVRMAAPAVLHEPSRLPHESHMQLPVQNPCPYPPRHLLAPSHHQIHTNQNTPHVEGSLVQPPVGYNPKACATSREPTHMHYAPTADSPSDISQNYVASFMNNGTQGRCLSKAFNEPMRPKTPPCAVPANVPSRDYMNTAVPNPRNPVPPPTAMPIAGILPGPTNGPHPLQPFQNDVQMKPDARGIMTGGSSLPSGVLPIGPHGYPIMMVPAGHYPVHGHPVVPMMAQKGVPHFPPSLHPMHHHPDVRQPTVHSVPVSSPPSTNVQSSVPQFSKPTTIPMSQHQVHIQTTDTSVQNSSTSSDATKRTIQTFLTEKLKRRHSEASGKFENGHADSDGMDSRVADHYPVVNNGAQSLTHVVPTSGITTPVQNMSGFPAGFTCVPPQVSRNTPPNISGRAQFGKAGPTPIAQTRKPGPPRKHGRRESFTDTTHKIPPQIPMGPAFPGMPAQRQYSTDLKSPDSGFGDNISPGGGFHSVSGTENGEPANKKPKPSTSHQTSSSTNHQAAKIGATVIPKLDPDLSGYRYYMDTNTSATQRIEEDRITYLNKGQFYGLVLEYKPMHRLVRSSTVKSVIMAVFREDKGSQEEQLKSWDFWYSRQHSIKMRILDVDTKNSEGIVANCVEEVAHNAVAICWKPLERSAKINIAVNSLSTDFSNQKGVKGVPLHIQVDTFENMTSATPMHRGYCQIKVFCDKGAERKIRDEERRKQLKTCGKRREDMYHTQEERSEFYAMADLTTPPVFFTPRVDSGELTSKTSQLDAKLYNWKTASSSEVPPVKQTRTEQRPSETVLLYVRECNETVFTALFLHQPNMENLAKAIGDKYCLGDTRVRNIYRRSRKGILVKMDNDIIRHYSDESAFVISIQRSDVTPLEPAYCDVTLSEIDVELK